MLLKQNYLKVLCLNDKSTNSFLFKTVILAVKTTVSLPPSSLFPIQFYSTTRTCLVACCIYQFRIVGHLSNVPSSPFFIKMEEEEEAPPLLIMPMQNTKKYHSDETYCFISA